MKNNDICPFCGSDKVSVHDNDGSVIMECYDCMRSNIKESEDVLRDKVRQLSEKVLGLEAELKEVIDVLLKVSPKHEEWIKINFKEYR